MHRHYVSFLLMIWLFVSEIPVWSAHMPRGSFLRQPAHSAAQLASHIRSDSVVASRYAKHFGVPAARFADYVQSHLGLRRLKSSGSYRVFFVKSNGNIGSAVRQLRKGTGVFVHLSTGKPVLLAECGNPMSTSLPGYSAPVSQGATPAEPTSTVRAPTEPIPENSLPPPMVSLAPDTIDDPMLAPLQAPELAPWEAEAALTMPDLPVRHVSPMAYAAPAPLSPLFVVGAGGLFSMGGNPSGRGGAAPSAVPEPASLVLWAVAGSAAASARWVRKRRKGSTARPLSARDRPQPHIVVYWFTRGNRQGMVQSWVTLGILAVVTLLCSGTVWSKPMPRGSFLVRPAYSAAQLATQIRTTPTVASRLSKHFGVPASSLAQYVQAHLGMRSLPRSGTYRVFFIKPDGSIGNRVRRLRKGTPVFLHLRSGRPVLLGACGNPLTVRLPGYVPPRAATAPPRLSQPPVTSPEAPSVVTALWETPETPPLPPMEATVPSPWQADPILSPMSPALETAPIPPKTRPNLVPLLLVGMLALVGEGNTLPNPPPAIPEPASVVSLATAILLWMAHERGRGRRH